MSRLYQFPGTEVVDLAALIHVGPLITGTRTGINPEYKGNSTIEPVLEERPYYFFVITLDTGLQIKVMNLSRDEGKAEGYREALIHAWRDWLEPKQEAFNQIRQGSQWPPGVV